ncbi:hypothetical protein DNK47_03230 [Mycoplasma wenyonii]|uniref:Uncharacterized protein n=1 Tax=Mycoplasma wenyonii TaxID=65123 RepID=A0A328PIZ4_9MOLU|nr:hypothetical protein [Mycoplasma wenyonii]RAO94772.1 hypothetical protein DNK47_03230 [Mycoplasma wenyonii]
MFIAKFALCNNFRGYPCCCSDYTPSLLTSEEINLVKSNPFEDCYVIETKNNESQKLLVCDNPDSFIFSDKLYYLYNTSDKSIKKAASIVKKHNSDEIVVKLEQKEVADSQDATVTLQVKSADWTGFSKDINLLTKKGVGLTPRDCMLTPVINNIYSSTSLTCNTKNPWLSKPIKITSFKVVTD